MFTYIILHSYSFPNIKQQHAPSRREVQIKKKTHLMDKYEVRTARPTTDGMTNESQFNTRYGQGMLLFSKVSNLTLATQSLKGNWKIFHQT